MGKGSTVMNLEYLNKKEYRDILLIKMVDNKNGDLPFFIRRYTMTSGNFTPELHRHECMQINYVYQGKADHLLNNQQFEIMKGDIFVIPPYIPHRIIESEDSCAEIFEFEFMPSFINQGFKNIQNAESFLDFAYIEPFLVSENLVKPRLNLVGRIQIEVEDILNEALREYNRKKPGYILLIRSLLLKLLVLVGRMFTMNLENVESRPIYDRHHDSIISAMRYIDTHYIEDLSIEEVANVFALSPSYFSSLFKNITSKTFTEYVNNIRISKAKELLKNTDKKVIDISYDVGFNNVYHFNRMFKQQIGISPLEYRKQE
jgi:AraC-like DNA-binding protein/quercetin dioxygenase-like cupin family protein